MRLELALPLSPPRVREPLLEPLLEELGGELGRCDVGAERLGADGCELCVRAFELGGGALVLPCGRVVIVGRCVTVGLRVVADGCDGAVRCVVADEP